MRDLTITIMQASLHWENPGANLAMFDDRIATMKERPDLVVLPEMFSTGFTMNAESVAEELNGPTAAWMVHTAQMGGFHMTGSLVIRENGAFYNRLLWVRPDGVVSSYDKRHLFRMSGEDRVYRAGSQRLTVDLDGWKVRPFICYDLRFPLWTRNINNFYDAAIYIASWPEKRAHQWKSLLIARAIENQCYVIGCNRTGFDGNGVTYSGDSTVIDPQGHTIMRQSGGEGILTVQLSHETLERYRESFPVWLDSDTDLFHP